MPLQSALIVDDSKLARITLQKLLEKQGLQVSAVDSGPAALDWLQQNTADVVFMDHLMPELDGFETTRRLKSDSRTADIPVIMCSGKEGDGDYESQAIAIGACGTLTKPPEPSRLQAVLDRAEHSRAASASAGADVQMTIEAPAPVFETDSESASAAAVAGGSTAALTEALDKLAALQNLTDDNRQSVEALQNLVETNRESVEALESRFHDFSGKMPEIPSFDGFQSGLRDLERRFDELANKQAEGEQAGRDLAVKIEQLHAGMQNFQPSETSSAGNDFDEEAFLERAVREVDAVLQNQFRSELDALIERIEARVDEAVSESRRDLDSALAEGLARMDQEVSQTLSKRLASVSEHLVNDVTTSMQPELDAQRSALDSLRSAMDNGAAESRPATPGGGMALSLAVAALLAALIALARGFGLF